MAKDNEYLDVLAEAVYWRCRVRELLETDHVESAKVLKTMLKRIGHSLSAPETEDVLNRVCELIRAYE